MSRVGRNPIAIPEKVTVAVDENNLVTVKGPLGELSREINCDMKVEVADSVVTVLRPNDQKKFKALHGLSRTLIFNMVKGVSEGYKKVLEVNGVGYRVQKQGKKIVLTLGYSHPVEVQEQEGIKIEVPTPNKIEVIGINKELVGQVAADIRSKRKPEPYKGKGIKYEDEYVRRKDGKAGKK